MMTCYARPHPGDAASSGFAGALASSGGGVPANYVTKDAVQALIDAAIDSRFPRSADATKVCAQCKQHLRRAAFTDSQYATANPVCKACKPVNENLQKRQKKTKMCSVCNKDIPRDGYSDTQWSQGASSKCKLCTAIRQAEAKNLTRECRCCKQSKDKESFSVTQWNMSKKVGSTCQVCCQQNAADRQQKFAAEKQAPTEAPIEDPNECWETHEVGEAKRWLLQASVTSLPSALAFADVFSKTPVYKSCPRTYRLCISYFEAVLYASYMRRGQEECTGDARTGQPTKLVDQVYQKGYFRHHSGTENFVY